MPYRVPKSHDVGNRRSIRLEIDFPIDKAVDWVVRTTRCSRVLAEAKVRAVLTEHLQREITFRTLVFAQDEASLDKLELWLVEDVAKYQRYGDNIEALEDRPILNLPAPSER